MNRSLLILVLAMTIWGTAQADVVYTKRSSNYLREGPGAFYGLIALVPENTALTVVERENSWLKVRLSDEKTGWLAANCLTEAKPANARIVPVENVWNSSKASRAGISAAIRGFAERHGKTSPGDVEKVMKSSVKNFTSAQFKAFCAPLESARPAVAGKVTWSDLNLGEVTYDAGLQEQEVGAGIAARMIQPGFVTDTKLLDYVNLVCAAIAASSESYDWDFTVFVLEDSTVNGYALPGGHIFVTRGALGLCADESELAAIIAHEMAHVIRKHGLQEMSKRIGTIRSDAAFAELEEEIGGEKSANEKELEDLMHDMYEKIVSPRLLSYELEADKIASVLLAAAGYDPYGLVRIAQKVARIPREKPDIFDTRYMAADDLGERARVIERFVKEEFEDATGGARMHDRFVESTTALRK